MRIAFVTTSYPAFPGDPSGHFVESEVKEARTARADDEVLVVTPALPPAGSGAFGWPGVASRVRARPHLLLEAARWALAARRELRALFPLDRIVAHWAIPSAWPVATGLGVPIEIVSHGADVRLLGKLPKLVRRALIERVLTDAHEWRFVSEPLLEALLASLDARDRRRVEAIACVRACPIDMPSVEARALEKRAAHPGVGLAVCVGRLVPDKRVDRVVDHVAREFPPRTRLVVVGDGPLLPRLEAHARARGVDALFVGRTTRPDALAWIAAADVVLHASRAEGLSTVEREARELGVPFRFVGTVHESRELG